MEFVYVLEEVNEKLTILKDNGSPKSYKGYSHKGDNPSEPIWTIQHTDNSGNVKRTITKGDFDLVWDDREEIFNNG